MSSHVSFFLILNVLFLVLDVRSLARSHGAVLHAVGDAVLLILLARVDFVDARMSRVVLPGASLSNSGADRNQTAYCHD